MNHRFNELKELGLHGGLCSPSASVLISINYAVYTHGWFYLTSLLFRRSDHYTVFGTKVIPIVYQLHVLTFHKVVYRLA